MSGQQLTADQRRLVLSWGDAIRGLERAESLAEAARVKRAMRRAQGMTHASETWSTEIDRNERAAAAHKAEADQLWEQLTGSRS